MNKLAASLLLVTACGGGMSESGDAALDTPVDMYRGASSILIHRPMPVGTRLHVQGVLGKHRRITAIANRFVLHQDDRHMQMAYDVNKTLAEVDLNGNPKRVRYDVSFVESTDQDLPPFAAMTQGRVARLRGPTEERVHQSGGQSFDFQRVDGKLKVAMVLGSLSGVEREALTDPLGPGYELGFERELAKLFGPKDPQREGGEWDIDLERAQQLLTVVGELAPPMKVTGKATFVGKEKVGDLPVQRIEAWILGEGALRTERGKKIHANINRVEVKYIGVFPSDPSLPPVEHEWRIKAKGHVVMDIEGVLADVHFDSTFEHQSRTLEVKR